MCRASTPRLPLVVRATPVIRCTMVGPPGVHFGATVQYGRASLFRGLPQEYEGRLEDVMDARFSASSWRKITVARDRWRALVSARGWPLVLAADDEERGGRLVTGVCRRA